MLSKQELCVCQICGVLDLPQPRVSKHLGVLRDRDLVIDERKDQYVFYSINKENPLLKSTIEDIINNIDSYPQLVRDQKRLKDIDKYLSLCNVENIKKIL